MPDPFDPSDSTGTPGHRGPWLLTPVGAAAPDGPFPITAEGLILGRDAASDVTLPAGRCPGVSARHARVRLADGVPLLEDLSSRNGTLVAGERVEQRTLGHGDELELGPGGPRFLVLAGDRLAETVAVPRSALGTPRGGAHGGERAAGRSARSLGEETMALVRKDLGLPEEAGVTELLTRHRRRVMLGAALLIAAGGAAAWFAFDRLREREAAATATLAARDSEREAELREIVRAQERRWAEEREALDAARLAWEAEHEKLRADRSQLEAAIGDLERAEVADRTELSRLRQQLIETNETLTRFDPLSLELAVQSGVARIERSVVLIEAQQYYREAKSQEPLYMEEEGPDGRTVSFNVSGAGTLLGEEATGSGFCISPDGWIITNAHVVYQKRSVAAIDVGPDLHLEPAVDVHVVFSGSEERHVAEFVSASREGKRDLALIKIEPFEGMPYVREFDLEAPLPARGADVYLIGFPLGRQVLQQGDTMIASAFRGIVSRAVDYYLQVDAAVHPGASGGPAIDVQGRIVGVVVGMQSLDENAESSAIGYIIPVAEVAEIWPHDGTPSAVEGGADAPPEDSTGPGGR